MSSFIKKLKELCTNGLYGNDESYCAKANEVIKLAEQLEAENRQLRSALKSEYERGVKYAREEALKIVRETFVEQVK